MLLESVSMNAVDGLRLCGWVVVGCWFSWDLEQGFGQCWAGRGVGAYVLLCEALLDCLDVSIAIHGAFSPSQAVFKQVPLSVCVSVCQRNMHVLCRWFCPGSG